MVGLFEEMCGFEKERPIYFEKKTAYYYESGLPLNSEILLDISSYLQPNYIGSSASSSTSSSSFSSSS